ncbi:MAG: helix-turn-helix domain-containing protein [Lentisphaeria bacterium]|nr:helix-turn-helix domain-containing protein [Lentisphaeria bacterium]
MSIDLLRISDVCKRLSVSKQTLYNLFKAGKIQRVNVAKGVRVPLDSVAAYVKNLKRR